MPRPTAPLDVTTGAPRVLRMDLGAFRVSGAIFPAGHVIPTHYHDRACVSVVVEGGFLQRFPGRACECPPGGVLVKPPREKHEDRWYDARARHLIVEPDPERHDRFGDLAGVLEEIRHLRDPGAGALSLRILRELELDEPGRALAVEALVLQLLARIVRGPADPARHRPPPRWLLRVRDLLHDRFREGPTLAELSAEAGVHPSHLSRTFSTHFGVGPAAYLRRLRLDAARRELAGTPDPIAAIAIRNGFSDQSHLTRSLKRRTGLTPVAYRRAHGSP